MAKPKVQIEERRYHQLGSGRVYDVAIRPGHPEVAAATRDGLVWIVGTDSDETRKLKGHHEATLGVAWSPDGKELISVGKDTTIRVWDGDTGEFLQDLNGVVAGPRSKTLRGQMMIASRPGHTSTVRVVAVSPSGIMATGGQDSLVKLWKNNEVQRTFNWHQAPITVLVWAPTQPNMVLSAGRDGVIRTWDAEAGTLRDRFFEPGDEIEAVAWLGEDRVASADLTGTVRLWEVGTEKMLRQFTAPTAVRCCVGLNERVLLMGMQNGEMLSYDTRIPRRMKDPTISSFEAHDFAVRCMDIDTEQKLLISGGDDGIVSVWDYTVS